MCNGHTDGRAIDCPVCRTEMWESMNAVFAGSGTQIVGEDADGNFVWGPEVAPVRVEEIE